MLEINPPHRNSTKRSTVNCQLITINCPLATEFFFTCCYNTTYNVDNHNPTPSLFTTHNPLRAESRFGLEYSR